MAETFEALVVLAFGVIPGGTFVWAFERQVGPWGSGFSDRLLRLTGTSVTFHAVAAPLSYWLWAEVVRPGRLARGEPLSWLYWLLVLAYVAVPWAIGTAAGLATREGWALPAILARIAPNRMPRAWDQLFAFPETGYVRIRLKSGRWIGGVFAGGWSGGPPSHASRYPEDGDLWLSRQAAMNEFGEFLMNDDFSPVLHPMGILIRWEEMEFLEFVPVALEAE